jgi:hypothetical protein
MLAETLQKVPAGYLGGAVATPAYIRAETASIPHLQPQLNEMPQAAPSLEDLAEERAQLTESIAWPGLSSKFMVGEDS